MIISKIARGIIEALKNTGDLVRYGSLQYKNSFQRGKKSLAIALQSIEYREGQRPIAEALFIIQGSYDGAYENYAEYLNWVESIRQTLLKSWDDEIQEIMQKDIENIALDVGVYADRGLFVLGLKVTFYNQVREI